MVMGEFPEFEVPPWRIRKFKTTDLDLIKQASQDALIPLITSIPSTFSKEEGDAYIRRQWSRHDQGTGYSFAIAEMSTDRAVGSIYLGLRNIDDGRASIGYWIIESFRGKGIAKSVLGRVVEWAQSDLDIPRLELYVEPWNISSIKTAEGAGFQKEGIMRSWQKVGDERKDMIMMSIVK